VYEVRLEFSHVWTHTVQRSRDKRSYKLFFAESDLAAACFDMHPLLNSTDIPNASILAWGAGRLAYAQTPRQTSATGDENTKTAAPMVITKCIIGT
jgi:hypothetical protein